MAAFSGLLDMLYYNVIAPFFVVLAHLMTLLFIAPMTTIGLPIALQVTLLALATALFSLWLRQRLRVGEKVAAFNETFAAKRVRQQDLQLVTDKYTRSAMYEASDDELNDDYNTFLAHHYGRYVLIYLLPIFLVMAWLNQTFPAEMLRHSLGQPFVLALPANSYGVQGLSVTAIFLLSYLLTLIASFGWHYFSLRTTTHRQVIADKLTL